MIALILGAAIGYFGGYGNRQISTVTSTVYLPMAATLTLPTTFSKSNGDWSFSIRLQSPLTAGPSGKGFDIYWNLTNISGQPQTVDVASPLTNPTIYSASGKVVWAWDPPGINYITTIPPKAGNWSGPVNVSTSGLPAGQYLLSVWPLVWANNSSVGIGSHPIGASLMINVTFAVE